MNLAQSHVGALVPVYGEARYLTETLDSLLEQDRPPDEVVVIDDGSPEPVRLLPRHAARCRLVRRAARGGPSAARQTGLAALGGELVALVDSDDLWEPGKLAAQLEALSRQTAAAVCFGRAMIIGPDGAPTGDRLEEPPAGLLEPGFLARVLFERNPIPTSSALIRRSALEAVGGFAGRAMPGGDDWDLWLRLVEHGERFVCEPRAVIRYRRHPGGLTADISAVAQHGLAVQAAHPGLVDPDTRRRVRSTYLALQARGLVRKRRYAEARAALREAAHAAPLGPRERLLRVVLALPGLRAALGRRSPYHRMPQTDWSRYGWKGAAREPAKHTR